ncbi:hypothetical protein [Algisphaera agarilytica]|uniref:Uncharacterized protein n=1 Tax=Algisphaera agarilytica TaxID=1385975 RepID=A0A7X0H876_9BACT|nr:hypothetical protein [Algisphaera agarilytica]MBB6431059.1 hypothetical protein [Algisphaera agarilytica]
MGRRQGRTPPYEIMQNVGSGTPLPRSGVRRVRGGSVGLLGLTWGGIKSIGGWFAGLGGFIADFRGFSSISERFGGGRGTNTVEVRLPWPVLVLLGVVGLAAMGLMFQIGHHVAGRSAVPAEQQQASAQDEQQQALAVESTIEGGMNQAESLGPVVEMGSAPVEPVQPLGGAKAQDPRLKGLNYFVLATVRPSEVTSEVNGIWALQEFLAEHGVATFLDSTNNDAFRVLVDVSRGYTAEEVRNVAYAEHEHYLRSLGREWKKLQGGIGTDLSDIYRDRYEGGPSTPTDPQ